MTTKDEWIEACGERMVQRYQDYCRANKFPIDLQEMVPRYRGIVEELYDLRVEVKKEVVVEMGKQLADHYVSTSELAALGTKVVEMAEAAEKSMKLIAAGIALNVREGSELETRVLHVELATALDHLQRLTPRVFKERWDMLGNLGLSYKKQILAYLSTWIQDAPDQGSEAVKMLVELFGPAEDAK